MLLGSELRRNLNEVLENGPNSKKKKREKLREKLIVAFCPGLPSVSSVLLLTTVSSVGSVLLWNLGAILTSIQRSLNICIRVLRKTHG